MPAAFLLLIAGALAMLVYRNASAAINPAPGADRAPDDLGSGDAGFSLGADMAPNVAGLLNQWGTSMSKIFTVPAAGAEYADAIAKAEADNGIPPSLLARLLYQESRFRQDIITGQTKSPVGAVGIAQFMPATAAEMGIDPLNPKQSIDAAGAYLARLYAKFGDWSKALAAYNWGQGNVQRKGLANAPTETKKYVAEILADVAIDG